MCNSSMDIAFRKMHDYSVWMLLVINRMIATVHPSFSVVMIAIDEASIYICEAIDSDETLENIDR